MSRTIVRSHVTVMAETADNLLEIFNLGEPRNHHECKIFTGDSFMFYADPPVEDRSMSMIFMQIGMEMDYLGDRVRTLTATALVSYEEFETMKTFNVTRLAVSFVDKRGFIEAAEINGSWVRCVPNGP